MLVATVINWGHVHAGNIFLVPGATVATLLMLGALHARRLYDDKKVYYCLSSTYFFQVFFKHKCSYFHSLLSSFLSLQMVFYVDTVFCFSQ